ncbi:MAG: Zn-dependent hydrolase [Anaerolineae bacterium]|jgi:N-carbamoyl-L-amino-acid hydrolase|nr:Zn-dependent hydrolase [Anaerolineae bacterium]
MDTADLRINPDRLRADFDDLSAIGATAEGGVTRLALSNEDLEARAWFANRIEDAGLVLRDDAIGNTSGILVMTQSAADPSFLVGSHLDSSLNSGRFDGAVGICAGLECLRTIREAGLRLPVNLEVISFTDQEGAWQSMLGSRGLTGRLGDLTAHRDAETIGAFRAALFRTGIIVNDLHEMYQAARPPEQVAGYLELHIEQGSRLYRSGKRLASVDGVVGRTTYLITFLGEASHSGTTDFDMRRDALRGAAAFITEAHDTIYLDFPGGMFNCGKIKVEPGVFNTIPAKAAVLCEVRHADEATLMTMEQHLLALAGRYAGRYNLDVQDKRVQHMPAAEMSPRIMQAISDACAGLCLPSPEVLTSYAGHDAQILAPFTETGMIFIPSINGISHNPNEDSRWEDVVLGANVLLHALIRAAGGSL